VALGARMSQVLGLVMRQTSLPVALGAMAGAAGALAIGGIVANQLFEVRARDPLITATVVILVAGAGMLTCALAARQGLTIDPASALRED